MNLQQRLESYIQESKKRVQRNKDAYEQCLEFTASEIQHLLDQYSQVTENSIRGRLIRDSIDHHIRRYHGYAVRGVYGSHYVEAGITQGIFEHVIPAGNLRDMLIKSVLTIEQALNCPTCLISSASDQKLRRHGLTSSSPDYWRFFRRYSVLGSTFTTCTGEPVNLDTWTLEDHFTFAAGLKNPYV